MDECQSLFKNYKICLDVSMLVTLSLAKKADVLQKALKERNIDSMLEDARTDNKDTDAKHLKRKCKYTQLPFEESKSLTNTGAASVQS